MSSALLRNSFFYLEHYFPQIVSFLIANFNRNSSNVLDLNVCVKNFALRILKNIFDMYETNNTYFINQILTVSKPILFLTKIDLHFSLLTELLYN